jgi:predicted nucleic acid-binding protein
MRYLLDANVLIGWLKGRAPAPELLEELNSRGDILAVNAISLAEIFSGLREDDVEVAEAFMAPLQYWEMDAGVARLAGQLRYRYARLGRPLSVADCLLAAHAIIEDATLVTGNVRDFPMPELKLLKLPE